MTNFVILEGRIKSDGEWVDETQNDGFSARAYIEVEGIKDGEIQSITEQLQILCHEARVFREGERLRIRGIYNEQQKYFVPLWLEPSNTMSHLKGRFYF